MSDQNTNAQGTEVKKAKKPLPFKKLAQFQTPDGKIFETQKEAGEHLRRHLVDEALAKVVEGTSVTVDWLKDNKEAILKAYDAAKIERPPVSEETKAKMKAARLKLAQAAAAQ